MNLTYEEKDKYIYIKANNKKNFSLKKSNYFQTYLKSENKFLEAYPIKPIQNIIPKDISLHKIFVIQKRRNATLFNIRYVSENLQKESCSDCVFMFIL